jgi:hypothetical protein
MSQFLLTTWLDQNPVPLIETSVFFVYYILLGYVSDVQAVCQKLSIHHDSVSLTSDQDMLMF